jgi:hypothetical protein
VRFTPADCACGADAVAIEISDNSAIVNTKRL